jgi:hypothetical protein
MSPLTHLKKLSNFKVLSAVLLLITGFSIWLYAAAAIQGYTNLLNSLTLSMEEVWSYEGSLTWWTTTYTTTIIPLVTVMITAGVLTLLTPIVFERIQQKTALRTFTKELELGSTEKLEIEQFRGQRMLNSR